MENFDKIWSIDWFENIDIYDRFCGVTIEKKKTNFANDWQLKLWVGSKNNLHLKSHKRCSTYNRRKISRNFGLGFFIWVILIQNSDILAYFCLYWISYYVFNKQSSTYPEFYLKSMSSNWNPCMTLYFALKARFFFVLTPFFARFSTFLGGKKGHIQISVITHWFQVKFWICRVLIIKNIIRNILQTKISKYFSVL